MDMKILFVADVPFEKPASGAEQVLHRQITAMAGDDGFAVCCITRHQTHPQPQIRKIAGAETGTYPADVRSVIRFLVPLFWFPRQIYRRLAGQSAFQVAVCHQPFTLFALLQLRGFRRVRIIYNFHSPSHEEYSLARGGERNCMGFLHINARRMIEKRCVKSAALVMVESAYMGRKVQKIHGIDARRVRVNPGGVDLAFYRPLTNRRQLKEKHGFRDNRIHLLTIRNLEPRMGLDNLLRTMALLCKQGSCVQLIVGGDGPEKPHLDALIRRLNLAGVVEMRGYIETNEMAEYYAAADFFVLPTRALEGFGLVTTEALACGTPVLGTPVGGTVEILSDFDPQFLFDGVSPDEMAEGIQRTIRRFPPDRSEYALLRERCRQFAEQKYSWDRHVDQLKTMIREVDAAARRINSKNASEEG